MRKATKQETTSELGKLKEAWRKMSPAQRDAWRARFCSASTQAELREEIKAKLGFHLRSDPLLTRFRNWDDERQSREEELERQREDRERIKAEIPGITTDELAQQVLRRAMERSMADGTFRPGVLAAREFRAFKELELDREKFIHLKKDQLEKALDALHNEIKDNPQALAAFQAFKAAIQTAQK